MKLSKAALLILRGGDTDFKTRLAAALDVHINTLRQYLRDNDHALTRSECLDFLKKETELSIDELLEKEPISEGVQK